MPAFREPARLSLPSRGRHAAAQQCDRARAALATAAALFSGAALLTAGCQLPNAEKAAREESILAIVTSTVPTPEEATRMANDASNPDRRARGITLLMNAPFGGEPVYVELYERRIAPADPVAGIEHEHPAVRAVAARALALHGDPGHVPLIVPLLDNEDPQVRLEAVQALQRLHNPVAVRPLLERLVRDRARAVGGRQPVETVESEPDIRAAAADALGQYAERQVLEGLIAALDDNSLAVTSRALKSLRTLTGQDLSDDALAWIAWLDQTQKAGEDPFADRTPYTYPVFERDFRWTDIIPFTHPAKNEIPSTPIGSQAG